MPLPPGAPAADAAHDQKTPGLARYKLGVHTAEDAAIKDSAVNSIERGWIRLTGVNPLMLWLACLMAVRNQRTLHAFGARQQDGTRRAAARGQQPRARKRRRELAAAPAVTRPSPTAAAANHQHRQRGYAALSPRPKRPPAPTGSTETPRHPPTAGDTRST